MKTTHFLGIFCIAFCSQIFAANKPDSLGLPGDNFDLYGALDLFKNSNSPEEFEKAINAPDNKINNLDLDGDGKVDYVKVIDKSKGDAHSLVMQVDVSKTETQDVAVVELEKTANGQAHVQIVGDEALYGKNYIVEPSTDPSQAQNNSSQQPPPSQNNSDVDDVYNDSPNYDPGNGNYNSGYYSPGPSVAINVWGWPSVQFMYGPAYVGWSSPWNWGYYPGWWQPCTPMYWGYYHRSMWGYHSNFYYHRTYSYSCRVAHNVYYGQRRTSETVRSNNRSGFYNQRQAAYRSAGAPAQRFNNSPANPRNDVSGRQTMARDNYVRQNNIGANNQPARQQAREQRQEQRQTSNQTSPQQSDRFNAQSRPMNEQRQMNAQPHEYVTRPQAQPMQRSGGFPHSAPMGGGGGRSFGGGGARMGGGGRR